MRRRGMPWMIAVALVVGSCGGTSQSTSTTDTRVTTTVAPTTTVPPTTTVAPSTSTTSPGCDAGERPDATDIAWVLADPDGDGVEDRLVGYEVDGSAHLRVEFDGGGSIDVDVPDSPGRLPIEPIGGHDLDGDGDDELFATVGWGAYTFVVGVWTLDGCDLLRITLDGQPASFPVGASVSNAAGLRCPDVGGLEAIGASRVDEGVFEGEISRYGLEGTALVRTETVEVEFDGDEFSAIPSFECADFTMSATP